MMRRTTFAVPAGLDAYAPEILYLNEANAANAVAEVTELSIVIEALPADAALELDLLRPGGDPQTAADWITAVASYTATGLQSLVALSRWAGARLRAKSGATAGDAVVSLAWW